MDSSFFDGISFQNIEIDGTRVRFPVRYFSYPMIVAGFGVPTDRVIKVLPSQRLKPVELAPGTSAIALLAAEYRDVDGLSPHNEFMILFSVLYDTDSEAPPLHGYYIFHSFVTTEETLRRVREVYGRPGSLADISFDDMNEARSCHVHADGLDVISFQVKKMATGSQSWDMYFYTVKDGQLLRSLVRGQGRQGISGDEGGASFTLGNHRISEELSLLDITGPSPLYRYSPQWQSISYAPGERLSM
jgi:hypothetical protein